MYHMHGSYFEKLIFSGYKICFCQWVLFLNLVRILFDVY